MKKIISLVLVAVLALTAIGGTLAYFTDTEKATNTFTMGNVDIQLIEQERGENGLQNFTNNKPLFPIVGSAQGETDEYGLPTAENYVDKIVTVKNLQQDAYVAVYVAVPKALLDDETGAYALHINVGNEYNKNGTGAITASEFEADWKCDYLFNNQALVTIDGGSYYVHRFIYQNKMTKDAETDTACMVGMYLDTRLDCNKDGEYTINDKVLEGVKELVAEGINIPVFAVATQAEGFDDAVTAIETTFGATYTPWAA